MKPNIRSHNSLRLPLALAVGLLHLAAFDARATSYASGITNNAGTISFILNEAADNVKVIFDGGGPGNTNDLGALAKGAQSFVLGAHTTYAIHVTKTSPLGWAKISTDNNPGNLYFSPGGIAVNIDPKNLTNFGRIYVCENVGGQATTVGTRTVFDGLYAVNADFSDALGFGDTAQTAGIPIIGGNVTEGQNSLFKIEVGEDGYLYCSDYSTGAGALWRVNPDLQSGELVAASGTGTPFTINGSAIVKGSLTGGNLQAWTCVGNWTNSANQMLRFDINSGPLPFYITNAVGLASNSIKSTVNVQSDLDIAPDGKFFMCQNRASGFAYTNEGLVNIRVFATDGVTELWNSYAQSTNILGVTNAGDIFNLARAIKVSPDGTKVAIIRNSMHVWLMSLTNGIPDISTRFLLDAFAPGTSSSTSLRREVSWDAAGNLYAGNNSREVVVCFSPGGSATTITSWDGTQGSFQKVVPPVTVVVTNNVNSVTEGGTVTFTVVRSGVTSTELPVGFTLGGTAAGGDYGVSHAGTVTFLPGAVATNVTVSTTDDSTAEFVETVSFALNSSNSYALGTPFTRTAAIIDNEPAEVSISALSSNLLEGFVGSRATFRVERKGLTNAAISANVSYSAGTAVLGTDFTGPTATNLAAGASGATIAISPINNLNYSGTRSAVASIAAGSYVIGTPSSAIANVIDDEVLPGVVLFSDKFDAAGSASQWQVNYVDGGVDTFADFGWDYTALSIPEAPNSTGSFTGNRGLRMRVNETSGSASLGLSASPLNGNFENNYRLCFDMWLNYFGTLNGGGAGSTQSGSAGAGTTGTTPIWHSGAADSVWFNVEGDGGSGTTTGDYNAWNALVLYEDASGVYAGGTGAGVRENFDPYYSVFGGVSAPAGQVSTYVSQTNSTPVGVIGMSWHRVVVTSRVTATATNVTWDIDGWRVATVNATEIPMSTNVFVGYLDRYASIVGAGSANALAVEFGLYDNLVVMTLGQPQITATAVINSGADAQVDFLGEPEDTPGNFTLQSSGTVDGIYNDVASTLTQTSPGKFRAVRATSGPTQFYRIRRL